MRSTRLISYTHPYAHAVPPPFVYTLSTHAAKVAGRRRRLAQLPKKAGDSCVTSPKREPSTTHRKWTGSRAVYSLGLYRHGSPFHLRYEQNLEPVFLT